MERNKSRAAEKKGHQEGKKRAKRSGNKPYNDEKGETF